jgi:hypothetical protein
MINRDGRLTVQCWRRDGLVGFLSRVMGMVWNSVIASHSSAQNAEEWGNAHLWVI